jgi:CDGSH-type Zn-finger protein
MTDTPIIARKAPFAVDVEAGRSYAWCACGRSQSQPLCDGSHKGTTLRPVRYTAEQDGKVWFCGCKQTAGQPLCDGTHNKL